MSTSFCYSYFFHLATLLHVIFGLFLLVTIDVVYKNSARFKYINSSCHFLELNYRGYNLNFLKLKQLLIDGDVESNSGPTQSECNFPSRHPKKIKSLKEQQKSVIIVKTMVMLLVVQRYKVVFSIQFNQST